LRARNFIIGHRPDRLYEHRLGFESGSHRSSMLSMALRCDVVGARRERCLIAIFDVTLQTKTLRPQDDSHR
jgi:hypothetical protein